MEKYIIDEKTGIGYMLRGDYYLPDLYLLQNETPMYGKYGFLRLEYLKECKRMLYINYLTQGNLMKRGSTPTFYTLDKICDGLGITLSQFFSEDIGKLELSSEQKRVLETWESLSDKEKAAVEIYVRGMKLK